MTLLSRSIALQGIGFKHPIIALQGFRYVSGDVVPDYIFVFNPPLVLSDVQSLKFGLTFSKPTSFNNASTVATGFISEHLATVQPISSSTGVSVSLITDSTTQTLPTANTTYTENKIEITTEVFVYEFK